MMNAIVLTSKDLKTGTNLNDPRLTDVRPSAVSLAQIHMADMIIYVGSKDLRLLKNRYGRIGKLLEVENDEYKEFLKWKHRKSRLNEIKQEINNG